jgi:hypothetical protein
MYAAAILGAMMALGALAALAIIPLGAAAARRTILIIRSLAPWQEPLYPELTANDRWFCSSATAFVCHHRTWLTLPPGREEYHPWFSRFHLASHALAEPHESADIVLWLDSDAVFFAHAAEVEHELLSWLPEQLASTPLYFAAADDSGDPTHTPKAYFVSNGSAAREVLAELSQLLPREEQPTVSGAKRGLQMQHAFASDRDGVRARSLGSVGQLELLSRRPALASRVGRAPGGRVIARVSAECACQLPLPGAWLPALRAQRELPTSDTQPDAQATAWMRPFIVHLNCGGEQADEIVRLARVAAQHNRRVGARAPDPSSRAVGGHLVSAAEHVHADPPLAPTPALLLIVYGEEFARTRTPVFVRSLLAARSGPLVVYILGDPPGLRAMRAVLDEHAHRAGLVRADDRFSLFSADASRFASALPSMIDPSCHAGGYAYLFYKLFAHELLLAADHLLVVDPDAIVLGDICRLWDELRTFQLAEMVGMAADQSHRYYYRLSDPTDEFFSSGWRGVPQRTGVNGGLMLLHLSRLRSTDWTSSVIGATHTGARLREEGALEGFCRLAEQDTINYLIALSPSIWHPIDCCWNYMGTAVGGHAIDMRQLHPLMLLYDQCPAGGPLGPDGAPGDLLHCECGRRIEILHFAGGTRKSSLRAALNESIFEITGEALRAAATARSRMPLHAAGHVLANGAHAPSVPRSPSQAARQNERSSGAVRNSLDDFRLCVHGERCPDKCIFDGSCPDPYTRRFCP